MKNLHPASVTIVSLFFIIVSTIVNDPLVIVGWSIIASALLLVLKFTNPYTWMVATGSGLFMGFGLGINHGLFPVPGADPYRAWAHVLRPVVLVHWSLFLSSVDPVLWAESLHRFWHLPLSWTYGAQASFRFLPLLAEDKKLSENWRRLWRKRSGTIVSNLIPLLVSALRSGAQSALALEARSLSPTRIWRRPLLWSMQDSFYVLFCLGAGAAWLFVVFNFNSGIQLWDGAF